MGMKFFFLLEMEKSCPKAQQNALLSTFNYFSIYNSFLCAIPVSTFLMRTHCLYQALLVDLLEQLLDTISTFNVKQGLLYFVAVFCCCCLFVCLFYFQFLLFIYFFLFLYFFKGSSSIISISAVEFTYYQMLLLQLLLV